MTVEPRIDDPVDQFPIGMRVLAVDDDPTCLLILETLLRRCQYHGIDCLEFLCFLHLFFDFGCLIMFVVLRFCFVC